MRRAITSILTITSTIIAGQAYEPPIMGWSSWNTYRVNISDTLITRQADALVGLGLDSAGYRYVNIDDGYFGGRDTTSGTLLFHPQRFPQGLKPVVDHIHTLGLKAGIYSDAGANTCGNFWDGDSLGQNVGLYGHDSDDCRLLFGDIGFDFIKVDFCGGDARQNVQQLSLDPEQRYIEIRRAIDATGRRDVKMNVCRWDYPGTWVGEIASSWRTTADINSSWQSVKGIIEENLYLSAYAGRGRYNDMDMLEVGRSLSPEEDRTHFAMWCMMSSPLLIGCDLTQLRPETLALLKNSDLIALNQDTAACQAYVIDSRDGTYTLVRDLGNPNGHTRAAALYNPTDSTRHMTLFMRDVELGGTVAIRDLTDRTDLEPTAGFLSVSVPAHGVKIYRLDGNKRLMRTKYEAETAFLPSYQEIENPIAAGTPYYRADSRCSGGICVALTGAGPQNSLIWDNVVCPADGYYDITVTYISDTPGRFILEAGNEGHEVTVPGTGKPERVTLCVLLSKGPNRIRLYNPNERMPDIDCMEIRL